MWQKNFTKDSAVRTFFALCQAESKRAALYQHAFERFHASCHTMSVIYEKIPTALAS